MDARTLDRLTREAARLATNGTHLRELLFALAAIHADADYREATPTRLRGRRCLQVRERGGAWQTLWTEPPRRRGRTRSAEPTREGRLVVRVTEEELRQVEAAAAGSSVAEVVRGALRGAGVLRG